MEVSLLYILLSMVYWSFGCCKTTITSTQTFKPLWKMMEVSATPELGFSPKQWDKHPCLKVVHVARSPRNCFAEKLHYCAMNCLSSKRHHIQYYIQLDKLALFIFLASIFFICCCILAWSHRRLEWYGKDLAGIFILLHIRKLQPKSPYNTHTYSWKNLFPFCPCLLKKAPSPRNMLFCV